MPPDFYLSKNIAMPGDSLSVIGTCVSGSTFESSDNQIAIINGSGNVSVVGIGETTISASGGTCTGSGILLVSTEDGRQPFMTKKSYDEYTNYQLIFIFFIIVIIFILRLGKI